MQILLPEAILSYPSLGKPAKNNFDDTQAPRYKGDIIFPTGTDLSELEALIGKHIEEDFKGRRPKNVFLKTTEGKIDKETGLQLPLYDQGEYFMSPWSSEDRPPVLISPQNKEGYPPQNFKGGDRVRVLINTWAGTGFGGTIGAGLMAVQWVGDGNVAMGAAKPNLNLFSAVPAQEFEFKA